MISALELKNKLERFDKNTPLLDYNVWFGFLPAIILFPLFVILSNAHTESLILNSPFLFGFGFAGFFIMSLVLMTGGLLITHFTLGRYIVAKEAVRRFNANSLLDTDFIVSEMAKGIWKHLKQYQKADPIYKADLEQVNQDLKKKADKDEIDNKLKKVDEDYNTLYRFVGIQNRENFINKTKSESDKDQEIKILKEKLDQVTDALLKALEELRRFRG